MLATYKYTHDPCVSWCKQGVHSCSFICAVYAGVMERSWTEFSQENGRLVKGIFSDGCADNADVQLQLEQKFLKCLGAGRTCQSRHTQLPQRTSGFFFFCKLIYVLNIAFQDHSNILTYHFIRILSMHIIKGSSYIKNKTRNVRWCAVTLTTYSLFWQRHFINWTVVLFIHLELRCAILWNICNWIATVNNNSTILFFLHFFTKRSF